MELVYTTKEMANNGKRSPLKENEGIWRELGYTYEASTDTWHLVFDGDPAYEYQNWSHFGHLTSDNPGWEKCTTAQTKGWIWKRLKQEEVPLEECSKNDAIWEAIVAVSRS